MADAPFSLGVRHEVGYFAQERFFPQVFPYINKEHFYIILIELVSGYLVQASI
jgi:hypothetical protein